MHGTRNRHLLTTVIVDELFPAAPLRMLNRGSDCFMSNMFRGPSTHRGRSVWAVGAGEDDMWLCRACELKEEGQPVPQCCLCPVTGGALKPTTLRGIWCHVACMHWIPEVSPPHHQPIYYLFSLLNFIRCHRRSLHPEPLHLHGAYLCWTDYGPWPRHLLRLPPPIEASWILHLARARTCRRSLHSTDTLCTLFVFVNGDVSQT